MMLPNTDSSRANHPIVSAIRIFELILIALLFAIYLPVTLIGENFDIAGPLLFLSLFYLVLLLVAARLIFCVIVRKIDILTMVLILPALSVMPVFPRFYASKEHVWNFARYEIHNQEYANNVSDKCGMSDNDCFLTMHVTIWQDCHSILIYDRSGQIEFSPNKRSTSWYKSASKASNYMTFYQKFSLLSFGNNFYSVIDCVIP